MSPDDDRLFLGHMLDTARRVQTRLAGVTKEDFDRNDDLQLAITRLLQIIGEAAWRVSDATQSSIPALPWKRMAGLRHRLVHDYFDVDLEIVWKTASGRMTEVIEALEPLLKDPNE
jgi:uncharacterized protein with HEPN domain